MYTIPQPVAGAELNEVSKSQVGSKTADPVRSANFALAVISPNEDFRRLKLKELIKDKTQYTALKKIILIKYPKDRIESYMQSVLNSKEDLTDLVKYIDELSTTNLRAASRMLVISGQILKLKFNHEFGDHERVVNFFKEFVLPFQGIPDYTSYIQELYDYFLILIFQRERLNPQMSTELLHVLTDLSFECEHIHQLVRILENSITIATKAVLESQIPTKRMGETGELANLFASVVHAETLEVRVAFFSKVNARNDFHNHSIPFAMLADSRREKRITEFILYILRVKYNISKTTANFDEVVSFLFAISQTEAATIPHDDVIENRRYRSLAHNILRIVKVIQRGQNLKMEIRMIALHDRDFLADLIEKHILPGHRHELPSHYSPKCLGIDVAAPGRVSAGEFYKKFLVKLLGSENQYEALERLLQLLLHLSVEEHETNDVLAHCIADGLLASQAILTEFSNQQSIKPTQTNIVDDVGACKNFFDLVLEPDSRNERFAGLLHYESIIRLEGIPVKMLTGSIKSRYEHFCEFYFTKIKILPEKHLAKQKSTALLNIMTRKRRIFDRYNTLSLAECL